MREGSYLEIEPGMPILGRDDEDLGVVEEVLEDEGSGIFVGLVVKPSGFFAHSLFVPGEKVESLEEGVVYVDATARDLEPYESPEETMAAREATE